jgi:hypothetical protein
MKLEISTKESISSFVVWLELSITFKSTTLVKLNLFKNDLGSDFLPPTDDDD